MIIKNILLMCIIHIVVVQIYTNDFLSKFHQGAYKIKNCRADVTYVDKNFMDIVEIKTFKFNRTVTAFNCTFGAKIDMMDKIEVLFQAYKRASNEYRRFPIRYQLNFCKIFNQNIYGLLNVLKCGNVTKCTWDKGVVYKVCNFVIDDTLFPPVIPTGEYKVEATLLYLEKEIVVTNSYGEVYLPLPKY